MIVRVCSAGFAIGVLLCTAVAQDHAPRVSTIELLGRVPDSPALEGVELATPVRHVSPNGLTTLVIAHRRVGLVTLRLSFDGAGALHDPEDRLGIAALTANLLAEATTSIPGRDLVSRFQELGATFSVSAPAGSPHAVIEVTGLSRNVEEWLRLAFDVVRNPAFPESALDTLISNRTRGLRIQTASLPFALESTFYSRLYPGHPASRRTATAASLRATAADEIRRWHDERYVPRNATMIVVGDVDPTALTGMVDRLVEGWSGVGVVVSIPPVPVLEAGRKVVLVDRPGSLQAGIALGNRTVTRSHPDYVALRVANEILGGGGLDQGDFVAYSEFAAPRFDGHWSLIAATRVDTVTTALDGLIAMVRRLQDGALRSEDLDEAKRSLIATFALSLEDAWSRATYAGLSEEYALGDGYWNEYIGLVRRVSLSDVERVAESYLDLEALRIAVVGDAEAIRPRLEAYGPVELAAAPSPD